MKVKALKLFGDGKRLYEEGEEMEISKELCDILNAATEAPLVEVLEDDTKGKPKKTKE